MKKILALVVVAAIALPTVAPVFASVPPGQQGYEGQPGNQGGYHQAGQQGYEGQPGNQGGYHQAGQQGYEGQPGNQGGPQHNP